VAIPFKSKGETADVIAEIIWASERCPKNLQTDIRKEFYNADVQKILKKYDINHYSTYSMLKTSVIERFNRTLKNDIWKMFTLNGKWIELPCLVRFQHAQASHTIDIWPADVTFTIAKRFLNTVYSTIKNRESCKIQSGWFGTREYKMIFDKGYTPNPRCLWSIKCSVLFL